MLPKLYIHVTHTDTSYTLMQNKSDTTCLFLSNRASRIYTLLLTRITQYDMEKNKDFLNL